MFPILVLIAAARAIVDLTGDAAKDFSDTSLDSTGVPKNARVIKIMDGPGNVTDVGVPRQPAGTISGWDVAAVFFQYDVTKDELLIGIDCWGICGDADGDGNPGAASPPLATLGGEDVPDLARAESVALLLDLNKDVADVLPSNRPNLLVPFDFVLGVPGGEPDGAVDDVGQGHHVATLPCARGKTGNAQFTMTDCFGLYDYQNSTSAISRRFLKPTLTANGTAWPVRNANPRPNATHPDLEWVLGNIKELHQKLDVPFVKGGPWTVLMQLFSGSFIDAGIGEDYLPWATEVAPVSFACVKFDACDVCLGDGSSCADCKGVPHGPAVYDACDVCGGSGGTCAPTTTTSKAPSTTSAPKTTTLTTTDTRTNATILTTTAAHTNATESDLTTTSTPSATNTTASLTNADDDDGVTSTAKPVDVVSGTQVATANALVSAATTTTTTAPTVAVVLVCVVSAWMSA